MPIFSYKAVSSDTGKEIKGTIDAENSRVARSKLRLQGIYVTTIDELGSEAAHDSKDILEKFKSNRVGLQHLSVGTRQLSTLIGAGLPLVGALQALSDQTEHKVLRRILVEVREKVEEGSSLHRALSLYPKAFPRIYTNMVASGEASGTLDTVLENLADYLESQLELRRKITSSLFYPALMFVFCTLVVIALLAFVVPNIVQIFEKQGATLPLPTRILIGVSNTLTTFWPLFIIILIGIFYGIRRYYKTPDGRSRIDYLILKSPLSGSLYQKIATARVARTLGALLASGVNLLQALEITKNIIGNVHVQKSLEEATVGVREGKSFAKELQKSGIFPSLFGSMVAVGEQSGKIDGMLQRAGKSYDNEVNASLSGLTSLIEPVMIIVLGGIVLCIVIAILMPVVDMINIVQR